MERTTRFRELRLYTAIALALIAGASCNSSPASSSRSREAGATADSNNNGSVDVMCIGDRIDNPPDSFHYSYIYTDASTSANKEADITPQAMDITIKDNSGSHSYHGLRSDETSWDQAVLDLSGLKITTMSSRLASLNGTSAVTRQGPEAINGYHAIRYAIDTKSANPTDRSKYETLFGKGSFEKGTAWMGADGCAVKLILDEGIWQTDAGINQVHYEMARIKK